MKIIYLLITSLLIFISSFGQMKETHINFKKEGIQFILSGLIEIDGHTFLNDTCVNPIKYKATLKGVEIFDRVKKYVVRMCSHENCNIIHLSEINDNGIIFKVNPEPYYFRNNLLNEIR